MSSLTARTKENTRLELWYSIRDDFFVYKQITNVFYYKGMLAGAILTFALVGGGSF